MRRAPAIATAAAAAALLAAGPGSAPALAGPPPALVRGVADSLSTVQIQLSDPVDPASVQPTDFNLEMVEAARPVTAVSVSPDGTRISLSSSSPWDPGTAGRVQLAGLGAINDRDGAPNASNDWVTVGAAPGDFVAPTVTRFRLTPNRNLCWVKGRRCKKPNTAWTFRSSEDGDAYIAVHKGRRLIGVRRYNGQPGSNYISFDGKIEGRRLTPGRYRAQIGVQDDVGNLTPANRQPAITFTVKSTRPKPR